MSRYREMEGDLQKRVLSTKKHINFPSKGHELRHFTNRISSRSCAVSLANAETLEWNLRIVSLPKGGV